MKCKEYEKELRKLQTELCRLQEWVVRTGVRVIVVFEGRDAAGKGGTIKAIMERVSPRVFRVAALPAPSDRDKSQLYVQRYIQHFPAAGEVVIFDRSWYNRAGVEYVMGFCTKDEYQDVRRELSELREPHRQGGNHPGQVLAGGRPGGTTAALRARIEDPLRQWKLSPMDLESYARWYAYSRARDMMLEATDTKDAPWHIVRSDDKRRARLNCIAHLLRLIPYEKTHRDKVKLPRQETKGEYDDQATLKGRTFVPERY